jgi:hypothetical protein
MITFNLNTTYDSNGWLYTVCVNDSNRWLYTVCVTIAYTIYYSITITYNILNDPK